MIAGVFEAVVAPEELPEEDDEDEAEVELLDDVVAEGEYIIGIRAGIDGNIVLEGVKLNNGVVYREVFIAP